MVLEWTLGQDRSSQLQHQSTSQGNMGDSEPPGICVSLVLVSFTLIYRAACPLLVKHSTINLSLTSEESLTDSKLGTGPKDRRQCMKLVLVSFTLFYSATYALILSVIHINVCAGYMCFVKL